MATTDHSSQPPGAGRAALLAALAIAGGATALSAIGPHDRLTWWLEVSPVLIGGALVFATRHRFPLSPLLLFLLVIHALILALGGHYTYARVPLGDTLRELFALERNPYDRIGHFAQGFVPAILVRELLLRTSPLAPGKWLFVLVTSVALAFSALYELIEWWAAVLLGADAESFLGTQGDVWDTQWDMALALSGALAAQLLLGRRHDRSLEQSGLAARDGSPRSGERLP